VELLYLPGLDDVVRDEVAERIPGVKRMSFVDDRNDSLAVTLSGPLNPLFRLTTVVAPFLVLSFPVPRPRSLTSGEYFPTIVNGIREAVRLNGKNPPRTFRLEAAGRTSPVMLAFASQVERATGLRHDDLDGECVIRLRRTPDRDGWDVLIRLSRLPLSARPWRAEGYHAAANATVAAAMVRLSNPQPGDRVANLMCGSGTILIERLLAAPAAAAIGIDVAEEAISAAVANAEAAGLAGQAKFFVDDIRGNAWLASDPYDSFFADPPWGDKSGKHSENETLHEMLLERAYAGSSRGARFVVLTHEVKIMERCVQRASSMWTLDSVTRVFQKGHHPRIYVLRRNENAGHHRDGERSA
jgi:tRNA (guanine6-N2)-methyltransferase